MPSPTGGSAAGAAPAGGGTLDLKRRGAEDQKTEVPIPISLAPGIASAEAAPPPTDEPSTAVPLGQFAAVERLEGRDTANAPFGADPQHFEQSVLEMPRNFLDGSEAVHTQNQESWMNHLIELTRHAAAYAGDNDVLKELEPGNRLPPNHT